MSERKRMTLCVIHDDSKVLLGMKKRGFGEGRWNGFGGKVHEGESVIDAAHRELKEEVGIEAVDLKKRGTIDFSFEGKPGEVLEVNIFSAKSFIGEPKESEEMRPEWFDFDTIPFEKMWPDDPHWLPHLLNGKDVNGYVHFKDQNTILHNGIKII